MNFLFASFPTTQGNTNLQFQHGPLCMSVPLIIFMRNGTHTHAHAHAHAHAHTHTMPLSMILLIYTCLIYLYIHLINLLI